MIRPTTDLKAIFRQQAAKAIQQKDKAIITAFSYVGELGVNHARSLNTYRDQTGNLRNSIGYVIVHNSKIVKTNFGRSAKGAKKATPTDGLLKGQQLAESLAIEILDGWGLIVVAGMNYALSVESRGLDVLTSAELLAKSVLPGIIKQLSDNITASIR